MCTIKEDHIIHGSWNIRHNGQNFLSFWTIFCPFTPSPNNPKNQNFEKMKKNTWRHKWQSYDIWFLRHGVQRQNFLSFWTNFALLLKNFEKLKKHLEILSFSTCVPYGVWFLRYEVWQTEFFVILDCFLPFYPP